MQHSSTDAATPGSDAALALGCTCPRIDNNYGDGLTDIDDGEIAFWIAGNCPLHSTTAQQETTPNAQ